MATRFYLEASGAPAISPAFSSGWESQVSGDRVAMFTTKQATAMANKTAAGTGTSGQDIIWRQFVGEPMAIGTGFQNGDALIGQIRCREASTTNNYAMVLGLRVFSNDGTTARAVLRSLVTMGTEFDGSALTNRSISTTLSGGYITVDAGDRLVLEVGFRCTSGADTANGTGSFGSNAGADLPVDETTTTVQDPWMEVVTDIVFDATLDHTMTADLGTFTLTGVAAALKVGHTLVAGLGTFTLSGNVADFPVVPSVLGPTGFGIGRNRFGLRNRRPGAWL
jgi:hypothetical protein